MVLETKGFTGVERVRAGEESCVRVVSGLHPGWQVREQTRAGSTPYWYTM